MLSGIDVPQCDVCVVTEPKICETARLDIESALAPLNEIKARVHSSAVNRKLIFPSQMTMHGGTIHVQAVQMLNPDNCESQNCEIFRIHAVEIENASSS